MAQGLILPPSVDQARDNWYRYQYMRDAGHRDFVEKARSCEDYVAGIQWADGDLAILKESGRPAMTINKLLSTIDHLDGEQLFNRASIAFRPARGMANSQIADSLTKVHRNIAYTNKLPWVRTDVFEDGLVTGRGFYDVRIESNNNYMGDVRVKREPPELIMLDPDASEYDPSTWLDVGKSSWVSLQEVSFMYGEELARELEPLEPGYSPYDFADDDFVRDGTFAAPGGYAFSSGQHYFPYGRQKFFRLFERQFYEVVTGQVFVDTVHGEIVPVPEVWDRDRIQQFMQANPAVQIMRKRIKKIRWTVTAGPLTLHDNWSPYKYFTIVPFFPHFRQGRTHGVVEHLLSPQDILNKSRSQELHVVNLSANSGWITEDNNLVNMTEQQLETHGAKNGLVIVVKSKDGIEKIKPNQIPSGLDRISFKAEEDMKNISGVSDHLTGFAREDVSGKALRANQAAGNTSFAPLFDKLARTDNLLGDRILNLIQTFYTEPRLIHVIGQKPGQKDQVLAVNEVTPEGEILNDLSLGEYEVVVTNEPERDSYEETQFDHAMQMRQELGIAIPDEFMIQVSKLRDKEELLEMMNPTDPEQEQFNQQMEQEIALAELEKLRGEGQNLKADALLKSVRATSEQVNLEQEQTGGMSPEIMAQTKADMLKENQKHVHKTNEANTEFMNSLALMREQHYLDKQLEAQRARSLPKPTPAK